MSALGNLLKENRIKLKLSQMALAKKMGWLSGQYASNYERGLSPPPVDGKLFDALGVDHKKAWLAYLKDVKTFFKSRV